VIRVVRAGAAKTAAQPQAEEGNPCHVGAPMPGMVAKVVVKPGQLVKKGDALVSIEAMKMETMIRAERDAVVDKVHAQAGAVVAAKDLLLEFTE
jgi:pyruvate carboxylase